MKFADISNADDTSSNSYGYGNAGIMNGHESHDQSVLRLQERSYWGSSS
ncbi:15525_t:CDS:2, partial [Dentiscutata erythropus]